MKNLYKLLFLFSLTFLGINSLYNTGYAQCPDGGSSVTGTAFDTSLQYPLAARPCLFICQNLILQTEW